MVRFNRSFALRLATALTLATTLYATAQACTRLVYLGPNDNVITARSMDWKNDIATHLWIFPRGMERSGEAGNRSLHWTSRYGSVIASGYDISTTDGVNEAAILRLLNDNWQHGITPIPAYTQLGAGFLPQLLDFIFWRGLPATTSGGVEYQAQAADHFPLYFDLSVR